MSISLSTLSIQGYHKQVDRLVEKLNENYLNRQVQLARKWAAIPGVKINSPFFNLPNMNRYLVDDIFNALCDMKINPWCFKGRHWWEFWKNDLEERIISAIKSL